MNPERSPEGDADTLRVEPYPQAIVLRDVVTQGRIALGRFRGSNDQGAGVSRLGAQSAGGRVPDHPRQSEPMVAGHGLESTMPVDSQAGVPDVCSEANLIEEEVRQRGYEEGFAQGRIEGRTRGDEDAKKVAALTAEKAARDLEAHAERMTSELKQQVQADYQARVQVLNGLIAALPPKIELRLTATEDDMLALCFEVVCRTLGESVVQPAMVRAQLARAVEKLGGRQLVAVHMHPDDLSMLQKGHGTAPVALGGSDVQWIGSAEVALGGCILQSPEGGLDTRFEVQLAAFRELLLQTRASARAVEA